MSTDEDRPLHDALIEPEESRTLPLGMVVALLVAAVSLSSVYAYSPDTRELDALSRSTSRAPSTDVRCSQGGTGPHATIVVDGRAYTCGGVECDRGGAGAAPRMVRYDPADPRRCRAEEGLGGATSWESGVAARGILGGVVALVMLAAMLLKYLAQRTARREFYASKAWREYVAQRDGEA